MFIVLLSFCKPLAHVAKISELKKCLSLNEEPCMIRPTFIDLDLVEVKYYKFRISLDKCTGSCNVLSSKICCPKETKDKKVNIFNVITNKKWCQSNDKTYVLWLQMQIYSSNQIWNNKTCQCQCKSIVDTTVIAFYEITSVMHIVSRKKTNNIAINLTKNYQSKKSKISNWLLYLTYNSISNHIIIDNYYYLLSLSKTLVKIKSY